MLNPSPATMTSTDPIRWSSTSETINAILLYCARQYDDDQRTGQHLEARREILARIYGNLLNPNHLAYPSEIDFEPVARGLTRDLSGGREKDGYIAALHEEWTELRAYFDQNFTKHDPDS